MGLKHPLLALSAREVAAAWGNSTVYVWAHRPLSESITGLRRRGWWAWHSGSGAAGQAALARALQSRLWAALRGFFACGPDPASAPGGGGDAEAEAAADARQCRGRGAGLVVVSYAALQRRPAETVRRLAAALGLQPTPEQVDAAIAAVANGPRWTIMW